MQIFHVAFIKKNKITSSMSFDVLRKTNSNKNYMVSKRQRDIYITKIIDCRKCNYIKLNFWYDIIIYLFYVKIRSNINHDVLNILYMWFCSMFYNEYDN